MGAPNLEYKKLMSLIYPSVEASGNVYYGQTRKLISDAYLDSNNPGFNSHIDSFTDSDGNYKSYFCWKLGPLFNKVDITDIFVDGIVYIPGSGDDLDPSAQPVWMYADQVIQPRNFNEVSIFMRYNLLVGDYTPDTSSNFYYNDYNNVGSGYFKTYFKDINIQPDKLIVVPDSNTPITTSTVSSEFLVDTANKQLYIRLFKTPLAYLTKVDNDFQCIDALNVPLTIKVVDESLTKINITNSTSSDITIYYRTSYSGSNFITRVINGSNTFSLLYGDDNPFGSFIQLKCDNQKIKISADGKFEAYGNIMSLVSSTGFADIDTLPSNTDFSYMFNNQQIVKAPLLPARDRESGCILDFMFHDCPFLTGDILLASKQEYHATLMFGIGNYISAEPLNLFVYADGTIYNSMLYENDRRKLLSTVIYVKDNAIKQSNDTDVMNSLDTYIKDHTSINKFESNDYLVDYIVSSGGKSPISDLMDRDTASTYEMNKYNYDGSYNQEIWGYKKFNGPVLFSNNLYTNGYTISNIAPYSDDNNQNWSKVSSISLISDHPVPAVDSDIPSTGILSGCATSNDPNLKRSETLIYSSLSEQNVPKLFASSTSSAGADIRIVSQQSSDTTESSNTLRAGSARIVANSGLTQTSVSMVTSLNNYVAVSSSYNTDHYSYSISLCTPGSMELACVDFKLSIGEGEDERTVVKAGISEGHYITISPSWFTISNNTITTFKGSVTFNNHVEGIMPYAYSYATGSTTGIKIPIGSTVYVYNNSFIMDHGQAYKFISGAWEAYGYNGSSLDSRDALTDTDSAHWYSGFPGSDSTLYYAYADGTPTNKLFIPANGSIFTVIAPGDGTAQHPLCILMRIK